MHISFPFLYLRVCVLVVARVLVCADSQQIYASNITNKIFAHESCKNFFAFALRHASEKL